MPAAQNVYVALFVEVIFERVLVFSFIYFNDYSQPRISSVDYKSLMYHYCRLMLTLI